MAKKRFIAIIEIESCWAEAQDKADMATWIDSALGRNHIVDSTVYDTITDLLADNALDALAESG